MASWWRPLASDTAGMDESGTAGIVGELYNDSTIHTPASIRRHPR